MRPPQVLCDNVPVPCFGAPSFLRQKDGAAYARQPQARGSQRGQGCGARQRRLSLVANTGEECGRQGYGAGLDRAFRIYRAEIDRDRRKPRYKAVADIFLANPAPAEVRNGAVTWRDTSLQYGRVYGYRIKAESARGGASKLSEEVRITPLLSLAPPGT